MCSLEYIYTYIDLCVYTFMFHKVNEAFSTKTRKITIITKIKKKKNKKMVERWFTKHGRKNTFYIPK